MSKCLGSHGAVEIIRKEVMVEVFKAQSMPSELAQMPLLSDLLDDGLGIGNGGAGISLKVNQEAQEPLCRHLV